MEPAYLTSLKEVLRGLEIAAVEAEAELPEALVKEHWLLVQSRTTAACWAELERRYPEERALDALALISEIHLKLEGLLRRVESDTRTPDLSLHRWSRDGMRGHQ